MKGQGGVGGGAVEQGLEALVNTCKQCQMWQAVGALAVGHVGRDFRHQIVYFGGSRV